MKCQAYVNAYLILIKEGKVLLSLRENTGYQDGLWSVVSGHVEEGESTLQGCIREAKEEIGVDVAVEDLTFVHALHRLTDRINLDLFFECHKWEGEPYNAEPHKCGGVKFYSLDELPNNMVDYVRKVLQGHELYSEKGWEMSAIPA